MTTLVDTIEAPPAVDNRPDNEDGIQTTFNGREYVLKKYIYRLRVEPIVKSLITGNERFQEKFVDQEEIIEDLTEQTMLHFSIQKLLTISKEELTEIYRKMMTWRLVYGLLSDLTPEEKQIFEESVARR